MPDPEPRLARPPGGPASVLLTPLAAGLTRVVLQPGLTGVAAANPGVFRRLAEVGSPTLLIDPTDFPLLFVLTTNPRSPTIVATPRRTPAPPAAAVVRAPLLVLLDILEGRIDGDAVFFSRQLEITGDTAVIVAVRNILDGAEIDLRGQLMAPLGPFKPLALRLAAVGETALRRLVAGISTASAAPRGEKHRPWN